MGSKKDAKTQSWGEWFIFWGMIFAGLFLLIGAAPVVPWRSARVDTNVGNRFAMERYYFLNGASDQFGKTQSWFSLKTKFQRKNEEFGRPSPLSALLGTAAAMAGGAGPAMGCSLWTACKEHVAMRYTSYTSVAYMGIATMALLFFSALLSAATLLMMNMEGSDSEKKKKKKSDEGLSPKGKTLTCCIFAWLFSMTGTLMFMIGLDSTLQNFKMTAYYPYAMSSVGAFSACFGCFIQWVALVVCINRVTPMCGKTKEEKEVDSGWEDPYGKGGYGKGMGKGPW